MADRTKALATSAEVSRRLSTIVDQQQLVDEVAGTGEIQPSITIMPRFIY